VKQVSIEFKADRNMQRISGTGKKRNRRNSEKIMRITTEMRKGIFE
jgi:hypothetical protein